MKIDAIVHRRVAEPFFGNISAALHEISIIVVRLEEASLHPDLFDAATTRKTRSLQDFDLILQSLADLAQLMDALGKYDPMRAMIDHDDLIAHMKLAWLRELVGGAPPQAAQDCARVSLF